MPVLKSWTDPDRESLRVRAEQARRDLEAETSWSKDDDHWPGEHWGLAPGATYWEADNDLDLSESNFATIYRGLEALDGRVAHLTIRHFVGGVPVHFILFPTDNVDAIDHALEVVGDLESYAVLDENDYYERRHQSWREALRWFDGVGDENVDAVAEWLIEHSDHSTDDPNDIDPDEVDHALLVLGLREPWDDEEDPLSAADESYVLFSKLGLTWPELHPHVVVQRLF